MVSNMNDYRKRKKEFIDYLGGKCINCGKIDNLHIDHRDHNSKNFDISKKWSLSWDRILAELKLCQLLCYDCHLEKTLSEGSLAKSWTTKPRGR
jgi:hypothetical protein